MVEAFYPSGPVQVYLARGATDMRKSVDGLASIVSYSFSLDPRSPSLFVFCNRGRNRLKILYWETNGFWLLYRRLDAGRFCWPPAQGLGQGMGTEPLQIDNRQLRWLLDGLDLNQIKAHPPLMLPAPPSPELLPQAVLSILAHPRRL